MPIDYSALTIGQEISAERLTIDANSLARYTDAVGDTSAPAARDGTPLAPPMAIAALALSAVINALQIPGGTIHAGQELEFTAAVPVGASIHCAATLAQNSVRRQWRFLVVNLIVQPTDANGAPATDSPQIMSGKSTIMLPV